MRTPKKRENALFIIHVHMYSDWLSSKKKKIENGDYVKVHINVHIHVHVITIGICVVCC